MVTWLTATRKQHALARRGARSIACAIGGIIMAAAAGSGGSVTAQHHENRGVKSS